MPTLTPTQRSILISSALLAREGSYSPYSNFRVGAALLLQDGQSIVRGANVENASYGGTICAERTAIVKAVSEGHRQFLGLAISSDVNSPISPCGICRQVLREFCELEMPILLLPSSPSSSTGKATLAEASARRAMENEEWDVVVETRLEELLPMSFGPSQLAKPDPGAVGR